MKRKTNISVQDNRGIRVTPNLIVGEKFNGYVSGDILDANSVADLVKGSEDVDIREVKYNELVSLKNNNKLVPGCKYRITDYVTTTAQANTQSAGHAFDIIVLATDTNVLNENALATKHKGDTYFANNDLTAWELKYSLDNDTDKFAWADSTNGKGVIYYMKDEFNNECPYDFKNIQYIKDVEFYYRGVAGATCTYIRKPSNDVIIDGLNYYCFEATNIKPSGPPVETYLYTKTLSLSTGMSMYKIINNTATKYTQGSITDVDNSNYTDFTFSLNNSTIGLDSSLNLNVISVYNNIIKEAYNIVNIAGNMQRTSLKLNKNIFKVKFASRLDVCCNFIGCGCSDNVFGGSCHNNTLLYNCIGNNFGNYCNYNILEDNCELNKFSISCNKNTLCKNCTSNEFGYDNIGNHLHTNCSNNVFGDSCHNNTLGDDSDSNVFSRHCISNNFDKNCSYNNINEECWLNSLGSGCSSNNIGENCVNNSFGKGCVHNELVEYADNVVFENGNKYISLTTDLTISSSSHLRNIIISQGVNNTNVQKTIIHNTLNDSFKTTYQAAESTIVNL